MRFSTIYCCIFFFLLYLAVCMKNDDETQKLRSNDDEGSTSKNGYKYESRTSFNDKDSAHLQPQISDSGSISSTLGYKTAQESFETNRSKEESERMESFKSCAESFAHPKCSRLKKIVCPCSRFGYDDDDESKPDFLTVVENGEILQHLYEEWIGSFKYLVKVKWLGFTGGGPKHCKKITNNVKFQTANNCLPYEDTELTTFEMEHMSLNHMWTVMYKGEKRVLSGHRCYCRARQEYPEGAVETKEFLYMISWHESYFIFQRMSPEENYGLTMWISGK